MDFVYVGITVLFFAAAAAYVAGCDRLGGDASWSSTISSGSS